MVEGGVILIAIDAIIDTNKVDKDLIGNLTHSLSAHDNMDRSHLA